MTAPKEVDVLIVGAGPVGIVAALQLARMGVGSTVLDRSEQPTRFPKMDVSNARTMELFELVGIAKDVRRVGVADHHSFDVLWTGDWDQPPYAVWDLPSVAEYRDLIEAKNDGTQPAQPYQRLPQSTFERLGRERLVDASLVDFLPGWTCSEVRQEAQDVVVEVVDPRAQSHTLRARYVIGCDGAESTVRKALGIALEGQTDLPDMFMVHFESRDRAALHKHGQFWHVFGSRGLGLIAQDEDKTWTGHAFLAPGEDPHSLSPEMVIADRIGCPIAIDRVLLTSAWRPQMLLADSYGTGRVFLAGDAAHQVFPTGGYGMNTGVGDAFDIAWKVGAVLKGWGGPGLLDSYGVERRPVAAVNRDMSARHASIHIGFHEMTDGGASRDSIRRYLQENRGENEYFGAEMGYRYRDSAIVVGDGSPEPEWSPSRYVPSSWPGSRPPSVRTGNGHSLFDRFRGDAFTMVDFSADGTGSAVIRAAENQGVPIRHVQVNDPVARELWERDLVLIRPDEHVGWRGNTLPENIESMLTTVTGR